MAPRLIDEMSYYFATVYYSVKSFLTYRFQASIWLTYDVLMMLFNIVAVSVIYGVSNGIAGWSYFQLLFLVFLADFTFNGFIAFALAPWNIAQNLREGKLDVFMTKPYGLLTLLLSSSCVLSGTGGVLASVLLGILALAYVALKLHFTLISLASFVLLYVSGSLAFSMFFLVLAIFAYYLLKSGEFMNQMNNSLWMVGRYPISVYGLPAQLFFTLAVPIGLASLYPVNALLGELAPLTVLILFLVASILAFAFYKAFYYLMRFYESGGG